MPLGAALPAMSLQEVSASAASASQDFMGAAGAFVRLVEDLGDEEKMNWETKSDVSYRSSEWSRGVMRTEGEESELASQCGSDDGNEDVGHAAPEVDGDTEVSDGYVPDGHALAAEDEEADGDLAAHEQVEEEADALPTGAEWFDAVETVDEQEDADVEEDPPPTPTIDWNSKESIELEKFFAFTYGKKFQERGPPAPSDGGPENWRGQAWREGKVSGVGRWGNRGQNSPGYARWLEKQNREKGKRGKGDKGKGSGKGGYGKGKGGKKGEGKGGKASGASSSSRVLPLAPKAPPLAPPQQPYLPGAPPPWRNTFGAYSASARD